MNAPDAELWAACDTCSRSFFVSSAASAAPETVICPVCGEVPARFEQRAGDEVVAVRTDVLT